MSNSEPESVQVGFRLPPEQLVLVDGLITLGLFKNRTEFFRVATTEKLMRFFDGQEEVFMEKLKDLEKKVELLKALQSNVNESSE